MLKLRSITRSPPGGFTFQDRATSWRIHTWSFNAAWSGWYQENVKRGTGKTKEQCAQDVEGYCCEQIMKEPGWDAWVLIDSPPTFVPTPDLSTLLTPAEISVIIPVYQPSDRLRKVIQSVKDQVNELIIVADPGGPIVPEIDNSKIKLVSGTSELGFGAKCNLGAKNAAGKYLWFLNDDCYPNPHCADKLMDVMTANPKIGAVGHLLRYPDGRIQHGGTHREAGKVGFPHLDHGSLGPCTLRSPIELEAITGASMLVRREAFDAVGGFDESYFLYLEDSDLCLKLRAAGWKVYYTPFAEAIHEGSQSSKERTDTAGIISRSVETFNVKWSDYMKNQPPAFESYESISQTLNIDVVYVHLVGDPNHEEMARRFVGSALKYPPGQRIRWVIALNMRQGMRLSDQTRSMFDKLGSVTYFEHEPGLGRDKTFSDYAAFLASVYSNNQFVTGIKEAACLELFHLLVNESHRPNQKFGWFAKVKQTVVPNGDLHALA